MSILTKGISVVVVTYNAGSAFVGHLEEYVHLFSKIIIVDNGSTDRTRFLIREIETTCSHVVSVFLEQNVGLAAAQNIGVRIALEDTSCEAIFFLDHDSHPTFEGLNHLIDAFAKLSKRSDLGVLGMCPQEQTEPTSTPMIAEQIKTTKQRTTSNDAVMTFTVMSSGSLVKRSIFETYGLMNESYFIDDVDHEFCLRLYCFGLKNYVAPNARLIHNLGERIEVKFLGRNRVLHAHSPARNYFIVRNAIWLWRNYFLKIPKYCLADANRLMKEIVRILVLDHSRRRDNLVKMLRGLYDGFCTALVRHPDL